MTSLDPTKAYIVYPDGTTVTVVPDEGQTTFNLVQMQRIVGGLIEIVSCSDQRLCICDEEGKLKGLKPNMTATKETGTTRDTIVGICLICPASNVK